MADLHPLAVFEDDLRTGDEKALLKAHLRLAQQSLLWKLADLSDDDLRRPMTRTGTNLIGIVKHLVGVTYVYLCATFGRDIEPIPWFRDEEFFHGLLDMWATPDDSVTEIVAMYRRACDAAAESIDALDLGTTGTHHSGLTVSLRWMILTVLLDTTRHAGHADVVREELDGRVGAYPGNLPAADDGNEYLATYRQRVAGDITKDEWLAYCRARA